MGSVTIPLVGNIATDVEAKPTPSGKKFVRFRVATNERYRDKTGEFQAAEPVFWDCEAWNAAAVAIAENLAKGSPVVVIGVMKSQAWKTEDGENRTRRYIKVEGIGPNLAAPPKKNAAPPDEAPPAEPDAAEAWATES